MQTIGAKKEEMKTMVLAGTGIMNSSASPSAVANQAAANGQQSKPGAANGYYGAGPQGGAGAYDSSKQPAGTGVVGQFGTTTALGISPVKVGGVDHTQQQLNSQNKRGSEFKKSAQHILNR